MLDFICMEPVDLPGKRRKRQNTKWKILAHSETLTQNPEISSLVLYRLSKPGLLNAVHLNDLITYMYSRYQCIHCYKYENDKGQPILPGKYIDLCYILEYNINIVQIAKRSIRPVLAFTMQTQPNILPDLVFACWKQAHDLCVSFLFVQYRSFQYVTQNSTFTRQITLYFIIFVLITMYTLVLGVNII